MVRATIILSVVAALIATVSAAPSDPLVNVDGGEYVGVGNVNAQGLLSNVVNADNLHAHDIGQNIDVISDDDDDFSMAGMSSNGGGRSGSSGNVRGSGSVRQPNYRAAADVGSGSSVTHNCNDDCDHGLLSHLLKREEAATAKKAMVKQMMKGRKMAMRKNVARKN